MRDYEEFYNVRELMIYPEGRYNGYFEYMTMVSDDGHWMSIVGPALLMPNGQKLVPPKAVTARIWSVLDSHKDRHPSWIPEIDEIVAPYTGGRSVTVEWFR